MSKSHSPLLGYNTNVRHNGKTYHVQTEDSGLNRPHIITHIFADGGRIVASRKTDYSKHLQTDNLEETIRNLMKEQHKEMLVALRNNAYEEGENAHTPNGRSNSSAQVAPNKASIPTRQDAKSERLPVSGGPGTRPKSVPPPARERAARARSGQMSAPDIAAFDKAAEARIQRSSLRSVLLPRTRKSQPPRTAVSSSTTRIKKEGDARSSKPRMLSIFGSDPSNEKSLDDVILNYLVGDDDRKK
jgi:hypothetical protein